MGVLRSNVPGWVTYALEQLLAQVVDGANTIERAFDRIYGNPALEPAFVEKARKWAAAKETVAAEAAAAKAASDAAAAAALAQATAAAAGEAAATTVIANGGGAAAAGAAAAAAAAAVLANPQPQQPLAEVASVEDPCAPPSGLLHDVELLEAPMHNAQVPRLRVRANKSGRERPGTSSRTSAAARAAARVAVSEPDDTSNDEGGADSDDGANAGSLRGGGRGRGGRGRGRGGKRATGEPAAAAAAAAALPPPAHDVEGDATSSSSSSDSESEGEDEVIEGEHEPASDGEHVPAASEEEVALPAPKRPKTASVPASVPLATPAAVMSRGGRLTGKITAAAAPTRAPAATVDGRSKDERAIPVYWSAVQTSVTLGKPKSIWAKHMSKVRTAVETVLLIFEACSEDARCTAWRTELGRMEAAYTAAINGNPEAITTCDVK